MPLAYDPEFAAAIAPLAEILASRPKLAPGDALGRREYANGMLQKMIASRPDVPGIKRKNHTATASDGTSLNIAEFRAEKDDIPKPSKAIYYIHGGGMILGSVDIFAKSMQQKVHDTGVPLFAVSYRLAPEHKHPIPVGDCYAGLQWLSKHATELGVDPARIVIMGGSAGGGLAAATALMARDNNLSPPLCKQILNYPMLDDRNTKPFPEIEPFATWNRDDNVTGWGALIGEHAGSADPKAVSEYAAPARAESLAGLPPTYIDCGQLDIFIYENVKYATRLLEANVPIELHTYPGCPHGFEGHAPDSKLAKLAVQATNNAILSA